MLLELVTQSTLPIVVVAGLGFVVQRRLHLDAPSLNRLQLHAISPCFLLHHLSSAAHPLREIGVTAWFTIVQFLGLVAVGWGAGAVLRTRREAQPVVALATAFAHSGDFGIPLVELAFGREYLLHQAVVSLHSVLITSLGVVVLDVTPPAPIPVALQVTGSAHTPVALFALGAQLASTRFRAPGEPLAVALGLRLVAPS